MSWEVAISGDKSDLEELSKVLIDKDLSIIERNENYFLRSKYLDMLSDYNEVTEKVSELLNLVNAGAKLTLDSRTIIKYNDISQLNEKGNIVKTFSTVNIGLSCNTFTCQISHSNGIVEMNNQAIQVRNWINIAQKDIFVKKIFTQVNHGFNSWIGLYNILEILQQAQFEPIGKNGAYRDKVNDITQTANSYEAILEESRHPGKPIPPPKNKIEFMEAKSFTQMVLFQWLDQKEQEWLNQKNRFI